MLKGSGNARNIANIAHDLRPLAKSLRDKLSLLARSRESDYQKMMKQIKMDAWMADKYILAITEEVIHHEIRAVNTAPRNIGNVISDLKPLVESLKGGLSALDQAERSSDYARTMRKINEAALAIENYILELDREVESHGVIKAHVAKIDLTK